MEVETMSKRTTLSILALTLFFLCGCTLSYNGSAVWSNARRAYHSDTHSFAKTTACLVSGLLVDLPLLPVTVVMDWVIEPPTGEDGHVYLTYGSTRKLWENEHVGIMRWVIAPLFASMIDGLMFPISASIDMYHVSVNVVPQTPDPILQDPHVSTSRRSSGQVASP